MKKQEAQATIKEIIEVISDLILQCVNKSDEDVNEDAKNKEIDNRYNII